MQVSLGTCSLQAKDSLDCFPFLDVHFVRVSCALAFEEAKIWWNCWQVSSSCWADSPGLQLRGTQRHSCQVSVLACCRLPSGKILVAGWLLDRFVIKLNPLCDWSTLGLHWSTLCAAHHDFFLLLMPVTGLWGMSMLPSRLVCY